MHIIHSTQLRATIESLIANSSQMIISPDLIVRQLLAQNTFGGALTTSKKAMLLVVEMVIGDEPDDDYIELLEHAQAFVDALRGFDDIYSVIAKLRAGDRARFNRLLLKEAWDVGQQITELLNAAFVDGTDDEDDEEDEKDEAAE
jgi:hypothetical protein